MIMIVITMAMLVVMILIEPGKTTSQSYEKFRRHFWIVLSPRHYKTVRDGRRDVAAEALAHINLGTHLKIYMVEKLYKTMFWYNTCCSYRGKAMYLQEVWIHEQTK